MYGRIKNGKVELQRFYEQEIKKHEGQPVEVIIGSQRSSNQNRYLWGIVYKIVGDELGYTDLEVHEVFKDKFLSYKKKGHKFTKSTASLKTGEFADYLNKVILYASTELGLIIPDPDIEFSNNE
jgi:hypothetical protein